MKKLMLSIMLLASSICYGTSYLVIDKIGANDMFIQMAKDKIEITEVRVLDHDMAGQMLVIFEFAS